VFSVSEVGSFTLCRQADLEGEALQEIRTISTLVRIATAPFAPLGLLLTGSFARGEGTIVRDATGSIRWLSDIECLVLFGDRSHADWTAIATAVAQICTTLNREPARLAKGLKIELSPIRISKLAQMRPAIFTHELSLNGKLLWGDAGRIQMPHAMSPGYDLRRDGLRLLNNRIVEHLKTRVLHETGGTDLLPMLYSLHKFWVEMATSLSVFIGCYAPSYRERSERLAAVFEGGCAASLKKIVAPLQSRLQSTTLKSSGAEISWSDLGAELSAVAAAAARLWWWETGDILADDSQPSDWREIARRLRRVQTHSQMIRDWGRLLLRRGAPTQITVQILPAIIRAGSFGHAIYGAACALAFSWDDLVNEASGSELLACLSRFLSVAVAADNAGRRRLAEAIFSAWVTHLRASAA
jgi:hypothetical protein